MEIKGTTQIVGIIGYPVRHTFSPLIHNFAFHYCGLDMCYIPFEVQPGNIVQAIGGLKALGIRGLNVTVPHKEAVIPCLDSLDDSALAVGAVNTIVCEGESMRGMNTDADGFMDAWDEEVHESLEGAHVAIIGTGGSARAVYSGLCRKKVRRITLISRRQESAETLHHYFSAGNVAIEQDIVVISQERTVEKRLSGCRALINCTPLGMKSRAQEMPLKLPSTPDRSCILFDLVYNPLETQFMKEGRAMGLPVFNGLGMLLHQGARAFSVWTGQQFPMDEVRKYLQEKINKERRD